MDFGAGRNGEEEFSRILKRVQPDLVHIFGTEAGHALPAVDAARALGIPVVVGLQGLTSTIAQHYTSGLPPWAVHGFTVRDVVRRENTHLLRSKYASWGREEVETLRRVQYVIGRTTWDRAVAELANPDVRYFSVPETIRPAFYESAWNFESCDPYSIFLSQGHYPIKGLHFVLEALPAIIERYPATRVVVSGHPPRGEGIRGRLKQTSYAAYLYRLMNRHDIRDRVRFVGVLDEGQMVEQYLRSHVFVSASTVENESNSLSEAKLLGLPAVASYVGGVVDRLEHGRDGFFYQHDAPYMLSHYVNKLFGDRSLCEVMGAESRRRSLVLNDPLANAKLMAEAYRHIVDPARA
ncbi:glycosyltransferase family 4 protein [Mariniluteicoccus flavus]